MDSVHPMVQCRGKSLYMYSTSRNHYMYYNSDISAAFSLSTAPNETCGITCEEFELPIFLFRHYHNIKQ